MVEVRHGKAPALHESAAMTAEYWVAQHIPDLLKNEPRNVGVFVRSGEMLGARFVGEGDDLRVDSRKLRGFKHASVYKQWIEFWRDAVADGDVDLATSCSVHHYRVSHGGVVDASARDSVQALADSVFEMLVESSFAQKIEGVDESESLIHAEVLTDEISTAFVELGLLGSETIVAHPIQRGAMLEGKNAVRHRVDFLQMNGAANIMEVIDFSGKGKERQRDHAARSAYVLRDIREEKGSMTVNAYSLVRLDSHELRSSETDYALALLRNESDVVEWQDTAQRRGFLEGRRQTALLL